MSQVDTRGSQGQRIELLIHLLCLQLPAEMFRAEEGPDCSDTQRAGTCGPASPSSADGRSHVTLNMSLILKGAERCQLPLNSAESKGRIRPQSVSSSRGLSNSQLLFKLGWFGGSPLLF